MTCAAPGTLLTQEEADDLPNGTLVEIKWPARLSKYIITRSAGFTYATPLAGTNAYLIGPVGKGDSDTQVKLVGKD